MANNKAFVRYANNKAVPGSLIVRKKAPSVGVWKEVNYDLCCDDVCPQCPDCPPVIPFCMENWAFENFDGTTFRNGDPIPQVTNNAAWAALTTPAWCYFNNNPLNGQIYGKLYNWYAVNDPRGLAPIGWRVPTDADWTALTTCLGGEEVAGGKMKTTGTTQDNTGLWLSPNIGATNESGFTGLPGGVRYSSDGSFSTISSFGNWWSSTEANTNDAWNRFLYYLFGNVLRVSSLKTNGFSVRLIKDI
jgi:uncharacterized protein (TIGR02145 family)